MRDISKYVDTESPLYDKLLRLYEENKDFPLENIKGRNVHHIVLRSWSKIDGEETDNTEENLVSLTAADHILAHFYIWKISKSPYRRSAASAWYFMSRNLIKFGIDENTIIYLIDKYNEEIKLCYKERLEHMSEVMKGHEPWIKGKHHSEEAKKKISEAGKGRRLSEEHKKKMSEALKGNTYALGYKHSEETKKKISEAGKGRKVSKEARKKISEAQKGKTISEETKKKIAETLRGRKRGHFSEETKKKMSKARKGKKLSDETKKKIGEVRKGKHWKLVDGKRVWY